MFRKLTMKKLIFLWLIGIFYTMDVCAESVEIIEQTETLQASTEVSVLESVSEHQLEDAINDQLCGDNEVLLAQLKDYITKVEAVYRQRYGMNTKSRLQTCLPAVSKIGAATLGSIALFIALNYGIDAYVEKLLDEHNHTTFYSERHRENRHWPYVEQVVKNAVDTTRHEIKRNVFWGMHCVSGGIIFLLIEQLATKWCNKPAEEDSLLAYCDELEKELNQLKNNVHETVQENEGTQKYLQHFDVLQKIVSDIKTANVHHDSSWNSLFLKKIFSAVCMSAGVWYANSKSYDRLEAFVDSRADRYLERLMNEEPRDKYRSRYTLYNETIFPTFRKIVPALNGAIWMFVVHQALSYLKNRGQTIRAKNYIAQLESLQQEFAVPENLMLNNDSAGDETIKNSDVQEVCIDEVDESGLIESVNSMVDCSH